MGYPEITPEQREMAVIMLANALRQDVHLRAREDELREQGDPLYAGLMRRRAEPSRRYVEGMRDLLRVLFPDGHAVAEACLEEAHARALGTPPAAPRTGNGAHDH